MQTSFPIDLKDSSYFGILATEVAYCVSLVFVDGIIEMAIKINRGEESVKNLVSDFKLQLEVDRQKRIGTFKSYLPSENKANQENETRRRNTTQ